MDPEKKEPEERTSWIKRWQAGKTARMPARREKAEKKLSALEPGKIEEQVIQAKWDIFGLFTKKVVSNSAESPDALGALAATTQKKTQEAFKRQASPKKSSNCCLPFRFSGTSSYSGKEEQERLTMEGTYKKKPGK